VRAACVLVATLVAASGCGPWGPLGVFPGGPLAGETVSGAVEDWSFTDEHLIVSIETRGRLFRHSVTVLCISEGGRLYIPSRFAPRKRWVQNILRDPRVRIGVEGRVYEGRAVRVSERGGDSDVSRAFLRKYVGIEAEHVRSLPEEPAPGDDHALMWMFRIDPPEEST